MEPKLIESQLDRLASINNRMISMPIHQKSIVQMHFWHAMNVRVMRGTAMCSEELIGALESALTWGELQPPQQPIKPIDFDKPIFPQAVAIMKKEAGRWGK